MNHLVRPSTSISKLRASLLIVSVCAVHLAAWADPRPAPGGSPTSATAAIPALDCPSSSSYAVRGQFAVGVRHDEWRDTRRNRAVPIRITYPSDCRESQPVVLFSHGLGGSRDGGALWAEHWARHGYLVVHLQHEGSDEGLWKGRDGDPVANVRSGMNARQLVARVEDVRFVLDELTSRSAQGDAVLARADLSRIGMSGHSFGAQTAQAVAGQRFLLPIPGQDGLAGDRIKAAIAFSPNARTRAANLDRQFGSITIPFLSLTGTKDVVPLLTDQPAEDRLLPYKHMPPGGKVLVNFDGADHMVLGGHTMRRPLTQLDRAIQSDVKALTLAFWDAYLKGDGAAKAWLADGCAAKALAASAEYSAK
jgi:predicted dienelactone hydrolase